MEWAVSDKTTKQQIRASQFNVYSAMFFTGRCLKGKQPYQNTNIPDSSGYLPYFRHTEHTTLQSSNNNCQYSSTHNYVICHSVAATAGLEWIPSSVDDGATFEACLGETVTFPWQFTTSDNETVVNVEWHKKSDGVETILATYNGGHFFASSATNLKLSFLANAGLRVSNFSWSDYGTYRVTVNLKQNGALVSTSRAAVLSPPDAPILAAGRLVAHVEPRPVMDNTTGQTHLQLSCGDFLNLGGRPVSVLWKRDVNSDLTAKDDSLASDIDVLRTELSRQSDADDALVSDVAEIRQKLDQREEEHRHLKGRVENLTKVNGALEDRLKSQESEYATLKTDVTQLSARLQQLADGYEQLRDQLTQQQTKQGKRVAFLARFGDNEQIKVSPPTKVVFNKLVFNIGGGFDPSTGVFTAPFAGVYVFNFQIYPSAGGLVQVDLMKNDGIEKRTKDFDGSVTLRVQAGDRFWVRDRMSPGSTLWGGVHTFFSGTLVSADE
ncbi:hypothetical protein BaRGS_00026515 [Batillaria attramentaria]|uniref:C1q domain-containing protein n=1 Tax=Batillaria attramentaria TaxID=370345 RepID=A0ABD0K4B3_9CAEN